MSSLLTRTVSYCVCSLGQGSGITIDDSQMIHHGDEQIKKEWCATRFHLHLHRPAPFEGIAAADDESEIMGSQFRVGGRRIGVGVAG